MKFDFNDMLKGIEEWDRKIAKATELYAETAAEKMVAEAKKNNNNSDLISEMQAELKKFE